MSLTVRSIFGRSMILYGNVNLIYILISNLHNATNDYNDSVR